MSKKFVLQMMVTAVWAATSFAAHAALPAPLATFDLAPAAIQAAAPALVTDSFESVAALEAMVFIHDGSAGAMSWLTVDPQTVLGAPVPEAAQWAMMLAGLGVVGSLARRRR
jgi:hypothetical protein